MKPKNMLAEFLKTKRLASGLSQRDVADRLHYSTPQFISNWERGVSQPPIAAIKKLGVMYGISSEDLFNQVLTQTIADVTADLRIKFASSK